METDFLGRTDAPVSAATWSLLDAAMIEAAKSQLAGRRLLSIEGPFGLGLKAIPLGDCAIEEGIAASPVIPVNLVTGSFFLNRRDIAACERDRLPLDTDPVAYAAIACAAKEDAIIFSGIQETPGLLAAGGSSSLALGKWDKPGDAAGEVIRAVTMLDNAGFHGPYCMGLAPARFNLLLRRYPQGDGTELDHIRKITGGDVVKAPVLKKGGVLLASGRQYCSIVLGQDMCIGFNGPAGDALEFSISESLALRIRDAEAICVLT